MEDKIIYETIGYIALILNIWGNMALTKKSIKGWIIRLFCNIAWIIYSYYFNVIPLLVNHVLFAGINIIGWCRWSAENYVYKVIKYANGIKTTVTTGIPKYWAKRICKQLNNSPDTELTTIFKVVKDIKP